MPAKFVLRFNAGIPLNGCAGGSMVETPPGATEQQHFFGNTVACLKFRDIAPSPLPQLTFYHGVRHVTGILCP